VVRYCLTVFDLDSPSGFTPLLITPAEILLALGNALPLNWNPQGYAYSALGIGLRSVFPRTAKHLANF